MPQAISKTAMDIMNEAMASVPANSVEDAKAMVGSSIVNLVGGVGDWKKVGSAIGLIHGAENGN